jgi:fructose-bisphosphate aldolase class II
LAVAIGTAHGAYIGTPVLDFDRLVAIKKTTGNFPLVMHGGSGSGDENIRKACTLGINKVNINNDLMVGARDALAKADLTGNGAYGLFKVAKAGWKARLKELIEILGGVNKAWTPASKGTPGAEIVFEEK